MSVTERRRTSARRESLLGDQPGAFSSARFVRITPMKARRVVDLVLARDTQDLAVEVQRRNRRRRGHCVEIHAPLDQPGLQRLHIGADAPRRVLCPAHGIDTAPGHQAEHGHHRQRHQHFDQGEAEPTTAGAVAHRARHW